MQFRIADTFTDSLAKLTGDEQKAVKTTAFDLQLNPANPGMSFHKLDRAKDPRFWSIRASRDIRLIVHKTDKSLLLCYVDHHDKAYHWAERRKLETHPKTGAAQLVEVREMVREIDVLGGEMAVAIDDTGIQFRVLNRKKGPAVQSPRAQADKHAYQARMEAAVLDQGGLEVIEGDVSGILTRSGSVTGVTLADGRAVRAGRVVLCSGTFLKGLMHVGDSRTTGGREGA